MRTFDGPDDTLLIEMTPDEVLLMNRVFMDAISHLDLTPQDHRAAVDLWSDWPAMEARAKQRRPGPLDSAMTPS